MHRVCGIAGFVNVPDCSDARSLIHAMTAEIRHRGPDDAGYYVDDLVAIGMTRLAIIDIAGGDQPKSARNGSLQCVFNGEIYNYRELRTELIALGHSFESASDSEVVARAFSQWGAQCFERLHGMFAIAVWERDQQRLTLARDRIGKKPLYIRRRGKSLSFASELKAFSAFGQRPEIDNQSVVEYFHLGYVPAPRAIWRGVTKLEAGHVAQFHQGELTSWPFWKIPPPPSEAERAEAPIVDVAAELERHLREAVRQRLVADVEVGVLLSGGIDSSLVAWAAASQHPSIRTFTIAFDDPALDESRHARVVAEALGTTHLEMEVTAKGALELVEELPVIYDEPFADSSAVPTTLLARAAREHVKVVLGGDGGDELFDGYRHYAAFQDIRRLRSLVPGPLRRAGRHLARSTLPLVSRAGNVVDKLDVNTAVTYRNVVAILAPGLLREVLGAPPDLSSLAARFEDAFQFGGRVGPRVADLHHYLPDDILVKVDRASMSTGLEVRAPFLETSLVEWALSLDPEQIGPPGAKAVPRRLFARHLPSSLAERQKQGFGVPLERWLLGPLRPLLEEHLAPDELRHHGLIQPASVRLLLDRLVAGRTGVATPLWAILMFQLWYDRWVGR